MLWDGTESKLHGFHFQCVWPIKWWLFIGVVSFFPVMFVCKVAALKDHRGITLLLNSQPKKTNWNFIWSGSRQTRTTHSLAVKFKAGFVFTNGTFMRYEKMTWWWWFFFPLSFVDFFFYAYQGPSVLSDRFYLCGEFPFKITSFI